MLVNVFQDGDHNLATITQDGGTAGLRGPIKATVDQTGSTQTATISQLSSSYVQASVYQRGMGNSGTVFQQDVNVSEATILQATSAGTSVIGNTATISQMSGNDLHATIDQRSDHNYAEINQGGGNDQLATITQSGGPLGNRAVISQSGSGHTGVLTQNGQENFGVIIQAGAGNFAQILQTGANFGSFSAPTKIDQNGTNLVAYISQK